MKRRGRLNSCSAYWGFQAQQNRLEGVELPGAAVLLDPFTGAGEELEPEPTDSIVVNMVAAP
jgi:hypothetical protein